MELHKILIVDDEEAVLFGYSKYLAKNGYTVQTATSLEEGMKKLETEPFDAVILDLHLPDGNAIDLIQDIRSRSEFIVIIVVTGVSDIQTAVSAMKLGADNFLTKPIQIEELCTILVKTLEVEELRRREAVHKRLSQKTNVCFGKSTEMQNIIHQAKVAAKSDSIILLLGETGTGKGVLAKWIHENSPRKDNTFVELNCSTLKGELLRSELYGHARGSFTSAIKDRDGLIEMADEGTLFLDEIGDMALSVQAELLKTLEEKSFRRIGENAVRRSDFRLICATNKNLLEASKQGLFRTDLYYRICVFPISLPALHERSEDIPLLAEHILKAFNYQSFPLDPEVVKLIKKYSWPGNIRELRNMLERALLLSQGKPLSTDHFPGIDLHSLAAHETSETWNLDQLEREHILKVLEFFKNDKNKTSKALGISLSSLYRKLETIDELETA